MGYAIVGGIGLVIGISFLIWALRERSSRHEAERAADAARVAATDLRQALSANQVALSTERDAHDATRLGANALRALLDALRVQLRASRDPATVKAWLDHELEETDL